MRLGKTISALGSMTAEALDLTLPPVPPIDPVLQDADHHAFLEALRPYYEPRCT